MCVLLHSWLCLYWCTQCKVFWIAVLRASHLQGVYETVIRISTSKSSCHTVISSYSRKGAKKNELILYEKTFNWMRLRHCSRSSGGITSRQKAYQPHVNGLWVCFVVDSISHRRISRIMGWGTRTSSQTLL